MEHLYLLRKTLLLLISTLTGFMAIAQSACGPVVQDFNTTGGTMAGFTSSTYLSTAPGFSFGQTAQNGYLQRCGIPSQGTVYVIASPTYQSLASATSIGWGFQLTGDVQASQVEVFLQYVDNNNEINSVSLYNNTATPYTGSGSNQQLVLCETKDISTINGFTGGEKYRIIVQLTASAASNNNQCILFDNFRTTGGISNAPLPVSFIGFGAKKSGSSIELIWNVAGERDVQGYEIERSTTGSNFSKLGAVAANHSTNYSFADIEPVNGTAFYRIKEIDLDGTYRYSAIVRLNFDKHIRLRAYPSPAKGEVTIEHALNGKGMLSLTTSDGKLVKQVAVTPELNQTVIDISNLKAGLYLVRFINGNGQIENTKLIKQ